MYIEKLNETVNKYNNVYHRTIKMKPGDVNPRMHFDLNKEDNKEGPTFKVEDHVRISNYKNTFAKLYVPHWSEEVFVIKKVFSDLKVKEIVGTFYKKELQKANQKELRVEKVIKRKGDKLYIKWKGCNSSFNSWINKKDLIQVTEQFPEPKSSRRILKFQLDLSNYATNTDLKNAAGVDISKFAKKVVQLI